MWTVGAEIGAVIGSASVLADIPYLDIIGKPLDKVAQGLEGQYGAIAWGQHGLAVAQNALGVDFSQSVYGLLSRGGDIRVDSLSSYAKSKGIIDAVLSKDLKELSESAKKITGKEESDALSAKITAVSARVGLLAYAKEKGVDVDSKVGLLQARLQAIADMKEQTPEEKAAKERALRAIGEELEKEDSKIVQLLAIKLREKYPQQYEQFRDRKSVV